MEPIRQAGDLLDRNLHMMRNGNSNGFMASYTENAKFIATCDSEIWSINKAMRELAKTHGKGWDLRCAGRELSWVCPGVVSFFERLAHPTYGQMRASGVCIQTKSGNFKIAHYVLSFMISNEAVESKRTGTMLKLMSEQPF